MHLDITFIFSTEQYVVRVNLIDNPGVNAWINHCKKLPETRSLNYPCVIHRPFPFRQHTWDFQQKIQQELQNSQTPIPLPVNEYNEITQHHLNVWHRWFTDHTKIMSADNNPHEFHWLHELNQVVHELELELFEWPKTTFPVPFGHEFSMWAPVDEHGFASFGHLDLTPYRDYHSWEPADLILEQSIHGKSVLRSFLDNDDPKHWDTTGHYITHGGCVLPCTHYRTEIYQSIQFEQWLSNNNVTRSALWPDYPLGHIQDRDQNLLNQISNNLLKDSNARAKFTFVQ